MVSLGRHFVPNPVLSDIIPRGPAHRIPFSFHTRYDGLARRILLRSYTAGSLAETRHLYYSSRWQVLEERIESGGQLAATADRQFVWGLRYIDDLLLRDRDTNSNGTLNERLYALQDANWNVTAVADPTGAIQERYAYTPYGTPFFLSPNFSPRASSQYDFTTLYTGREYDAPTGLYYYRSRYYQPGLGVFVGRDPVRYRGSKWNLYEYVKGSPTGITDPNGQAPWYCITCGGCAVSVVAVCQGICVGSHWDDINDTYWQCVGKCYRAIWHGEHLDHPTGAVWGFACVIACSACPPEMFFEFGGGAGGGGGGNGGGGDLPQPNRPPAIHTPDPCWQAA